MPSEKLTATKVRKVVEPGRYGDGGNLYLCVRPGGSRAWVVRYTIPGRKARDMGLGNANEVSLAEARTRAAEARLLLRSGTDPIDARAEAKKAAEGQATTFRELAVVYIEMQKPSWKNEKHQAQWTSTLETYVYPALGDVAVAKINVADVLRVLQPIWLTKTETASRLRGRVEKILDYAKAKGLRTGENPAVWRGHLSSLLPPPSSIAREEHHPALNWEDCPAFIQALATREGASPQALKFTILTAARTGMTISATWKEIDLKKKEWVVPGHRMKGDKNRPDFHVPLSLSALQVLAEMRPEVVNPSDYIFPGDKMNTGLSNMAMLTLLGRMGRDDITVHGFRSSFRDWAALKTQYKREIVEAALAHTNQDKTEAAYQRSDLPELRVALMQDWAKFLAVLPAAAV